MIFALPFLSYLILMFSFAAFGEWAVVDKNGFDEWIIIWSILTFLYVIRKIKHTLHKDKKDENVY